MLWEFQTAPPITSLRALVEKGFVKLESFSNNTRKGQYAYLLTPKGIGEKSLLTHRFIKRKRVEFEALRAEIMALEEEIGPKDAKIEQPLNTEK